MENKFHMEMQTGIKDGNPHIIMNLTENSEILLEDLLKKRIMKTKLINGKNKDKFHNLFSEKWENTTF